jgi:hypothetical protein
MTTYIYYILFLANIILGINFFITFINRKSLFNNDYLQTYFKYLLPIVPLLILNIFTKFIKLDTNITFLLIYPFVIILFTNIFNKNLVKK